MDSICHQIYRYVINKKKACAFSIVRDLGIEKSTVKKYLEQLVHEGLLKYSFVLNLNHKMKTEDGPLKIFRSPIGV